MKKIRYIYFLVIALLAHGAQAASILVSNPQQLNNALTNAQPGDTILLDKGNWKDVALTIETNGTKEKPVVIAAATPGAVQFTGNSFIKFGSDYVVVSGIHFVDGFAEKGAVIEFRKNNDKLANHCRLTNCVIDSYNKPGRFDNENWIILWGQYNRIDHCTIGNKLTGGTTIIVELNDERSQQNHHEIDSNYFNGRLPLGSNGGETIRVGVSRYALTSSRTNIHHNYFERCSGEVEIISIKSGDNQINCNTFLECEGGLVLRHGERNTVSNNVFFGRNKPYTGGVRVINPGHTVSNNFFVDLAGERFHSAFSVLNGVPNSLPNRYVQVKDVQIHHNTFINCKSIVFGAGKDPERTAAPQNVVFRNNFIASKGKRLYEDANNDGGILFSGNTYVAPGVTTIVKGFTAGKGLDTLINIYPMIKHDKGIDIEQLPVMNAKETGAAWYTPSKPTLTASVTYSVSAAQSKQLAAIVAKAKAGDIIQLTDTGLYQIEEPLVVRTLLTIKGAKSQLVNVGEKSLPAFIVIENGGSVTVENIQFNSAYKSYDDVQAAISTTVKPMNSHYRLQVNNCEFFNFNESSFACIRGTKSTYADSVIITNSLFHHNSGTGIDFSSEKDDKGIYNVAHLVVTGCVFTNMLSTAINVYRGGNDESTTGPDVLIDHCTFNEVENRMQGCVVKLLGAQIATVTNCVFNKSGAGGRCIWFEEMSWDKLKVDYCNFYKSGRVSSFFNNVTGKHIFYNTPVFNNPSLYDFRLASGNLVAADGKRLGVN
ncbi:chondroitinase-B domain-containing protein [Niastella sp. OAS944]|uniref:chondroitinase-B domain-containing protein n=1 Tax=Niastella sp. OAS944 TaxID=2664089 RepID=UPI003477FDC7|nr:poly(beta-D-mannuronate) lyase [Chitinophagaceae bacterium OAS944]